MWCGDGMWCGVVRRGEMVMGCGDVMCIRKLQDMSTLEILFNKYKGQVGWLGLGLELGLELGARDRLQQVQRTGRLVRVRVKS